MDAPRDTKPWWLLLGAVVIVVACDITGHKLSLETLGFIAAGMTWYTGHSRFSLPKAKPGNVLDAGASLPPQGPSPLRPVKKGS